MSSKFAEQSLHSFRVQVAYERRILDEANEDAVALDHLGALDSRLVVFLGPCERPLRELWPRELSGPSWQKFDLVALNLGTGLPTWVGAQLGVCSLDWEAA